jgi:hypothetical protein
MSGLERSFDSAVTACRDRGGRYRRVPGVAGRLDDLLKDVLTLAPRSKRERLPSIYLAAAVNEPCQRAGRGFATLDWPLAAFHGMNRTQQSRSLPLAGCVDRRQCDDTRHACRGVWFHSEDASGEGGSQLSSPASELPSDKTNSSLPDLSI